jgi:hypothetical protein
MSRHPSRRVDSGDDEVVVTVSPASRRPSSSGRRSRSSSRRHASRNHQYFRSSSGCTTTTTTTTTTRLLRRETSASQTKTFLSRKESMASVVSFQTTTTTYTADTTGGSTAAEFEHYQKCEAVQQQPMITCEDVGGRSNNRLFAVAAEGAETSLVRMPSLLSRSSSTVAPGLVQFPPEESVVCLPTPPAEPEPKVNAAAASIHYHYYLNNHTSPWSAFPKARRSRPFSTQTLPPHVQPVLTLPHSSSSSYTTISPPTSSSSISSTSSSSSLPSEIVATATDALTKKDFDPPPNPEAEAAAARVHQAMQQKLLQYYGSTFPQAGVPPASLSYFPHAQQSPFAPPPPSHRITDALMSNNRDTSGSHDSDNTSLLLLNLSLSS